MSVNKVILLGRLGQEPELKYTPSGVAVCSFSLATSENWTDRNGQKQEKTEWHRIVVWGKLGELCNQYLNKGRQLYLEGRLQTRTWEDKTGAKRYTTEINATSVQFIGANAPNEKGAPGQNIQNRSADTNSNNNNVFEQDFDISSDPGFTSDDIPF